MTSERITLHASPFTVARVPTRNHGYERVLRSASPLTVALPLAVGVFALIGFILRLRRPQRTDSALLDLRTFRSRTFTMSIVTMAISMMALFGTLIILPLYMQDMLGLPTLTTGLLLLPGGLVMGLLSPVVGRLDGRIGPRALVVPGAVTVSVVFWDLALLLRANTSIWLVLAAHVLLSVGLALTFTPLFTAALNSVRPALYSAIAAAFFVRTPPPDAEGAKPDVAPVRT